MVDAKLLTLPEVQAETHLSRSTLYKLVQAGELLSVKVGRSRRVPADALRAYVARLIADAQAGN